MEVKNISDSAELLEPSTSERNDYISRLVNFQPLSYNQLKLKSYPLDHISEQRVQEALVVKDLLNVLIGLEGIYIRYNNSYDPMKVQDLDLRGPDFKIAKNMDLSLKSFTKRIIKLGKIFAVLTKFSTKFTESKYGSVLHKFCFEIRQFLTQVYLKFVVDECEEQFKNYSQYSIRNLEQALNNECIYKAQILYELCQDILQEMSRRQMMDRAEVDFNNFIDDLRKEERNVAGTSSVSTTNDLENGILLMTDSRLCPLAKGGIVLQLLQNKLKSSWGDQRNMEFLKQIFQNVSASYCSMLEKWLVDGVLNDPYDEFMIGDTAMNPSTQLNSLNSERLWDTQYVIRKDGLMEQFQDKSVQFKVLMTGKLLNLFKHSCDLNSLEGLLPEYHTEALKVLPQDTELKLYVDRSYERANKLVWLLFKDGYHLPQVLLQFQKSYMLSGNSTFISKFFNKSIVELTRIKSEPIQLKLQRNFEYFQKQNSTGGLVSQLMNLNLDKNSLSELVEQFSSISATTREQLEEEHHGNSLLKAHNFQNLRDMLLRDLQKGTGTTTARYSIHYLQFEIIVPFPLNCLISKPFVVQYQIIQRHLLLLHYYNKILEDTWFEINKNKIWKYRQFPIEVHQWIRHCRILHDKMTQFMKLVMEYMVHDVVDKEWRSLNEYLTENGNHHIYQCSLKLQNFLTNVMAHSLLTNSSLIKLELQIMEIVHKYCKFVTSLRKTLCLMDHDLFTRYKDQLQDAEFDETWALDKFQELDRYLRLVSTSFHQHLVAFVEGVRYYSDHGSGGSQGNVVMALAERLSSYVS